MTMIAAGHVQVGMRISRDEARRVHHDPHSEFDRRDIRAGIVYVIEPRSRCNAHRFIALDPGDSQRRSFSYSYLVAPNDALIDVELPS